MAKWVGFVAVLLVLWFSVCESIPIKKINGKTFALTPVGLVPASCVTELPQNGAHVRQDSSGSLHADIHSTESDQLIDSFKIPLCEESILTKGPFPPDYDGWLAYTSFNNEQPLTSFLGSFSVPDTPSSNPDILYVFTGLQNVDWVPKVDPIPTKFDIIQPVLQYPGDEGNYWSVKSWYVTVRDGVQVTKELKLDVGDVVFGNMTMTGNDTWFIGSTSTKTGQSVSLSATHEVLKSQPWAYTTVECYGCSGCPTEPTQSIQFTSLTLNQGSSPVTPQWQAFQSPNPICDTTAVINSPESVTMTFGSQE